MERFGVTTILSWKLETFNWKSRIQKLGVPCMVWLIRGCLPNTRHGSATASSTQVLVEEGFGCYHLPGAEESIRWAGRSCMCVLNYGSTNTKLTRKKLKVTDLGMLEPLCWLLLWGRLVSPSKRELPPQTSPNQKKTQCITRLSLVDDSTKELLPWQYWLSISCKINENRNRKFRQ